MGRGCILTLQTLRALRAAWAVLSLCSVTSSHRTGGRGLCKCLRGSGGTHSSAHAQLHWFPRVVLLLLPLTVVREVKTPGVPQKEGPRVSVPSARHRASRWPLPGGWPPRPRPSGGRRRGKKGPRGGSWAQPSSSQNSLYPSDFSEAPKPPRLPASSPEGFRPRESRACGFTAQAEPRS